jgi:hypothetical protein
MNETPKTLAPDAGKWVGRVLIAVILGEGIWGLIVSITNNLVLPFLARNMGGDIQSPLYLGKGDFNVPALFTSVLELCFAGIAAVILNCWVRRKSRPPTRSGSVRVNPVPSQSNASLSPPPAAGPVQATASVFPSAAAPAAPSPSQFWSPPDPGPRPQAAPPAPAKVKPKPPQEAIYNSVGEPINPTEGD